MTRVHGWGVRETFTPHPAMIAVLERDFAHLPRDPLGLVVVTGLDGTVACYGKDDDGEWFGFVRETDMGNEQTKAKPNAAGKASKAPDADPMKAAAARARGKGTAKDTAKRAPDHPKTETQAPPRVAAGGVAVEDDFFFGGNPDEPVVNTDPFGVPVVRPPKNEAVTGADIEFVTAAANLLDTAKTRLEAKLVDAEALAAFGGAEAVQLALRTLAYIAANPDVRSRYAAAKAALDATYP